MSDDNLFTAAAEKNLTKRTPLANRLRPTSLDDVVGQDHILGPGRPLRVLAETDQLTSVLLWGPAGVGKTTIARLLAKTSAKEFIQLSAVDASVKDVRETISRAKEGLGTSDRGTILFLDEVHRFTKNQQDALLPAVESGIITLIGATTENPFFEVNAPLRSRSTLFRLRSLDTDGLLILLRRGLEYENATASEESLEYLANRSAGDGRQALTTLEVAAALSKGTEGKPMVEITLAHAEAATDLKALRYGQDEHYDIISAFIKSIRGSDPDAAIYWLARMLSAGEDPKFIARRLIVHASEDIGMADPMSLLVANAAAHAVEFVGLPEARINLAQATVHLATAEKSNRSYDALNQAMSDVQDRPAGDVPKHLRDAHYRGAASLGHGEGYQYPHNAESGWVDQQYLPDGLAGRRYYKPTTRGYEAELHGRLSEARSPSSDEPD